MRIKEFIGKEGEARIVAAIKAAELHTSGEIRVHIESKCSGEVLDRAVYVFNYLKMYKTEARNGVLIYIAVDSRKLAIIGDSGINSKVPVTFWDAIKQKMGVAFAAGQYVDGLCTAIEEAGISLKTYFPYRKDDINEQPDEISFGN